MGHFSNGSEFYEWETQHCDRCWHMPIDTDNGGCPIVGAMMFIRGNSAEQVFDSIIPLDPKTREAGPCQMFLERSRVDANQTDL